MKYLIILLLLSVVPAEAQVNWMTMNEALAAQEKEPRKILLKAYTDWCVNCKWMDQYAFAKAELASYINANYYPVAFNAEGVEPVTYQGTTYKNLQKNRNKNSQHQFAEQLGIMEYPTLVFFDESGKVINPVPGKMDSRRLEVYVTMLADDTYRTINTGKKWSDYQKNFMYRLQD
ncbi:MAG: thioredoxin fold domain-containing protein [Nonlabens sp.]